MDARTNLQTQLVNMELNAKRQRAAEQRMARAARTGTTIKSEAAMGNGRFGRLQHTVGRYGLAKTLVAALVGGLLAAGLLGQVLADEPSAVGWSGGRVARHAVVQRGTVRGAVVVRGGRTPQLLRGGSPARELLLAPQAGRRVKS